MVQAAQAPPGNGKTATAVASAKAFPPNHVAGADGVAVPTPHGGAVASTNANGVPDRNINGTTAAKPPAAVTNNAAQARENGDSEPGGSAAPAEGATDGAKGDQTQTEEQRKKDDEILAKGKEIAGIRALLSRAYGRPAPEPARPLSHWYFLLQEMSWLATDFSQERLWKRTVALGIAYEIAKKKGDFGLKPPPKEWRRYSDEIRDLRAAALRNEAASPSAFAGTATATSSGRPIRAARAAAAPSGAPSSTSAAASPAAFLALDFATDPAIADLEAGAGILGANDDDSNENINGLDPGTPRLDDFSLSATVPVDDFDGFVDSLHERLTQCELERCIQEECTYRSYRLEYEAAVASHQLAVTEQQRQANAIGDLSLGLGFAAEPEEDVYAASRKPQKRARKSGGRASGGGFLGLEDLGEDEFGAGAGGGQASRRAPANKNAYMVEDVYLKKRRPQRVPAFRDTDADFDFNAEAGGPRYGTRRQTGALARQRQAAAGGRRIGSGGRADTYQQQQAAKAQAAHKIPGMAWTKAEDELLMAVVHEFGLNWQLVSEVLNLSLSLLGVYRPGTQCRARFKMLCMQQDEQYSEERAYQMLLSRLGKQSARELLHQSLPVRDDALGRLLEALVQVGATARGKRLSEEKRNEQWRSRRQDPHASYTQVVANLMSQTGGRHLSPLELANTVNNTYLQQQAAARQQQLLLAQQQAAAVAATAAQQQHAAGAAAPAAAAAAVGTAAGPPAGAGAPPNAAPGSGQSTPAGMASLGLSASGSLPPPAGAAAGTVAPPGTAGGATGATPQPQHLTPQQFSSMEDMRKVIEAKRQWAFQQQQQQQQQQQRPAAGQPANGASVVGAAAGGAVPAGSNAPMPAAMQARPPLPPGMYAVAAPGGMALPVGTPGVPPSMVLPPGVATAHIAGAGSGVALPPGVQSGMMLPPAAQQQLLAQQMAAQQQAQAAAQVQQQQQQSRSPG